MRKMRVKDLCVKGLCVKKLCVCVKALPFPRWVQVALPSDAVECRAGRSAITRHKDLAGGELTGQCPHVCPARRISPLPLLSYLVRSKRRPQAHKSASSRHRPARQYVALIGTGARSKT